MFKKLFTILFISLTFLIFAQEKAINSLDVWKKDLEKLDGYRVNDFIKIHLRHQIINYLVENNIFGAEEYFDFLKELDPNINLFNHEECLYEEVERMLKIARIKRDLKYFNELDIEKFFDKTNKYKKNKILLSLIHCYLEENAIEKANLLVKCMKNYKTDAVFRHSKFLQETCWGYEAKTAKAYKDKALLELVKFYLRENDLKHAMSCFDRIKSVAIKFEGLREFLKIASKKYDPAMPDNILKFFQEKFLKKVVVDSPINYIFWLSQYEPAIFYYFLESHVRNYSTDLINEHPIWDQIKRSPGQWVRLEYLDDYQKIIRYIIARQYEKVDDINIPNSFSNSNAMVKAKLLEEFYKEWDQNESTLPIEYAGISDDLSGFASDLDNLLLLMTNYCKRGFWEKADKIFNREFCTTASGALSLYEYEAFKVLIYYMEKDKQRKCLD